MMFTKQLKLLFFSLLLYFTPCASLTSSCEDITGVWRNELGSVVAIDHSESGIIRGKYYTAVSLSRGIHLGHDIVGTLPYNKPGSSFAFSVTWQNGSSTTVWTGQCQVCNGKETLETSWLLRSFVDSCVDKWKSTMIGKDLFKRTTKKSSYDKILERTKRTAPMGHSLCDLRGIWYNDIGSEVILNQTESGVITGEYRTAVERESGSAGQTHSLVYGSGAFGNPNTTFSLIVVWREGKSVTGWVGQCHICKNNTVTLEMTWLLRSKVDSCDDVWKSTMFGVNSFIHHDRRSGPRKSLGKHTPNRNGEDVDGGGAHYLMPPTFWPILALFCIWLVNHW